MRGIRMSTMHAVKQTAATSTITLAVNDAVCLLELADLIDDQAPTERAAATRLRYMLRGVMQPLACPTCQRPVGSPHRSTCDVAVCLVTGLPRAECDRDHGDHFGFAGDMKLIPSDWCGDDIWRGYWPGADDADALGWFVRWEPPEGEPAEHGRTLVRCDGLDVRAVPDIARLAAEARWDRQQARWVAP